MAGLAFGSAYAGLPYFSIGWMGQAQPRLAARFEIGWQPHYPTTLLYLTLGITFFFIDNFTDSEGFPRPSRTEGDGFYRPSPSVTH